MGSSWGPWAIGDHGAPVSLPKLKKAYEKGTRGISWGPLLTPGPRAVPELPNGQSAPDPYHVNALQGLDKPIISRGYLRWERLPSG
ncbi:unnamed protein product [Staurois parvus]|uniref:Uncharacterized protein n=1 Tax=Staurois parvus TaxID=386267 RepID=A0ABN9ETF1_9NEOB|nr:unnamed protein product [Staurois parvus]